MHKIIRLAYTLLYLKPIQVRYQVWYKIKNRFLTIDQYSKYQKDTIHPIKADNASLLIVSQGKYIDGSTFCFLNITHQFPQKVDWNYIDNGKLWNYNLQYFDYLQDESNSVSARVELLKDFSMQILERKIKPEPYPASLRIINILLFRSRHEVQDKLIDEALLKQIHYLESNLEYHILANHLLENIYALYISAIALRNKALFAKAEKLLHDQLDEQILADGAHYECSPMYHSIILSKLLLCIEITENDHHFKTDTTKLRSHASKMVGWLNEYSFKDGSWALMNDAALGIAPDSQTLIKAVANLNIQPASVNLKESGYRKLKGLSWEALVDVGNIIPSFQPGHAHADIFSFCLWYKGKPVIVDPGISTYNNNSLRQEQRSTGAHNTVLVNNSNQSDVWAGFRIGRRAKCTIIKDAIHELIVQHNGYKRFGVTHRRHFRLTEKELIISDILIGNNKKSVQEATINILFDKEVGCKLVDDKCFLSNGILILADRKLKLAEGYYSTRYNINYTTNRLHLMLDKSSELRIMFP